MKTSAQKKGQRASVRRCISPTEIKQWARARLLAHTRAIRKFVCGLSLSWVSALLSLLFIILTIAYAFYPQSVSHLKAIGGSPSSALVVLRILSEVAGVLLAATTAAAFEKLQFTLVAREGDGGGLRFLDYLSLQAGAGVPGLMGIVFWRGDIKMATRVWSIVRLISIVLVPILNIVAMSDVRTAPTFNRVETTPTYGFGIGTFNASLAKLWAPATDLLFSTGFNEFMSDTTRTVPVTETANNRNCAPRDQAGNTSDCVSTFYVPGGIENSVRWVLESNGSINANAYLAIDQQGYIFEFRNNPQSSAYSVTQDCSVYGSELFAFALCLKSGADQVIQAHITLCPRDFESGTCFYNTAWRGNDGWKTTVKTSYRRATVAYSRYNGTILSHKFSKTPPVVAPINATELLQAFDIILGTSTSNFTELITPFAAFGSRKPALPYFIWWYFHGISGLPVHDAGANARAVAGLQSLLALTIYHCQAKDFADLQHGLGYNNSTAIGRMILSLFPTAERDTAILPAILRYNIVVGHGSLIAYVIMSGTVWLLCLVVLILGSANAAARRANGTTYFPALDVCTKYEVLDTDGEEVSKEQLLSLNSLPLKRCVQETGKMKVRLAQGHGG